MTESVPSPLYGHDVLAQRMLIVLEEKEQGIEQCQCTYWLGHFHRSSLQCSWLMQRMDTPTPNNHPTSLWHSCPGHSPWQWCAPTNVHCSSLSIFLSFILTGFSLKSSTSFVVLVISNILNILYLADEALLLPGTTAAKSSCLLLWISITESIFVSFSFLERCI